MANVRTLAAGLDRACGAAWGEAQHAAHDDLAGLGGGLDALARDQNLAVGARVGRQVGDDLQLACVLDTEGDPLKDRDAREEVRDYRHLQTVLRRKPATVSNALAAIDVNDVRLSARKASCGSLAPRSQWTLRPNPGRTPAMTATPIQRVFAAVS